MDYPNRKAPRIRGYDYSTPGVYFITVCTKDRAPIFGTISNGDIYHKPEMHLSKIGTIAENEILNVDKHYANVKIDKYVIMPNHIHILIRITERINPFPTTPKYDIPNIVGKFKAAVTRNVGKAFMPSANLWQTSFHDHIVRGEQDCREIWQYIDTNPQKWTQDCFYEVTT